MKNFVQDGHTIDMTNSGSVGIASGTPVAVGDVLAIAIADIAVGETGMALTTAVVQLPKVAADNIAQGKTVYFKSGKGQLDSSGATVAGKAWQAAGANITTVMVKLNG